MCKECHSYHYVHERGYEPYLRLEEVRKWVWEVIHRSGGMNAAARTLGISPTTLYRWLGRYKGNDQKKIRRESVRHVLEVLAQLRAGTLKPAPPKKAGGRSYKYGCSACGVDVDEHTPGCSVCWERHYNRRRRSANMGGGVV